MKKEYTAKTQYRKFEKIFPEKELRGLSPYCHIHVSVSDLCIPMIGLTILLQENIWTLTPNPSPEKGGEISFKKYCSCNFLRKILFFRVV
jgi:hypothetical protein